MRTRSTLVLSAASALLLAGCGGGGDSKQSEALVAGTPGNRAFGGPFSNVKSAPTGSPAVIGTAEMVLGKGRTRVTILASGLDNKAVYIGHVHADLCSATDPGGPHFKFDPNGGDAPPNEIHLPIQFEVNRQGQSKAAVTSDVYAEREAGPGAKSVVIHLKRAAGASADEVKPPKVACADLKPDGGI